MCEELIKSLRELQEVYAECDYSCGKCLNRMECIKYDSDVLQKICVQAADAIEELSKAKEPGEWIPIEGYSGVEWGGIKEKWIVGFRCSACDFEIDVSESHFDFCPNCGKPMKNMKETEAEELERRKT